MNDSRKDFKSALSLNTPITSELFRTFYEYHIITFAFKSYLFNYIIESMTV